MEFTKILQDEQTFPDSAEITMGNEKVTLGQIRDLSRSQQKAITERMDALQRERDEVKTLATTAADLMTKLNTQAATEPVKTTPSDFDADPWWEPVRSKLSPIEKAIKEVQDTQKAINSALERSATIWATDRWKSQYAGVKDRLKPDKYKDWTFEKVRDYAAQQKILDEYGFPAVDKAVEVITREDELERIRQEAYEKGAREGSVKGRLATMARPTSSAGAKHTAEAGLDPSKNFEDLGDVALSDPSIAKMLADINAIDPSEIQ